MSSVDRVLRWLAPFDPGLSLRLPEASPECPVLAWAACGGMALTGCAGEVPVAAPAPLHSLLAAAGEAITGLTASLGRSVKIDPALVLGGRAALLGLSRRGQISAGGATRLLRCRDGWCAVSIARPDDLALVPAILGRGGVDDEWDELATAARDAPASGFADHVQQFGVPAAALPARIPAVGVPWQVARIASPAPGRRLAGARVVDLSALWAGPLCARILGQAGATVVKVESIRRPDGARSGNTGFYDWLHAGHRSVALDFTTTSGRDAIAGLIESADIVIEASRPRALRQLGLAPEQLDHRHGTVWLSITGYGRAEPNHVAFGDDAAVAGGLVGWHRDRPVFCADAIADPLTGICAALAATASVASGGGHHIDLAMRDVAAAFADAPPVDHGPHETRRTETGWVVHCPTHNRIEPVAAPRAPEPTGSAARLGADNDRVLGTSDAREAVRTRLPRRE